MTASEKAREIEDAWAKACEDNHGANPFSPVGLELHRKIIARALEEYANERLEEAAKECDERAETYQEKVDAYGSVTNGDMVWPAYAANLEMAKELAEVIRELKREGER